MAKLVTQEAPKEPTYVFELTLSEVNAINSVINDLWDPIRQVYLVYPMDGGAVVPTELTRDRLKVVSHVLEEATREHFGGYDYDDWFVARKED